MVSIPAWNTITPIFIRCGWSLAVEASIIKLQLQLALQNFCPSFSRGWPGGHLNKHHSHCNVSQFLFPSPLSSFKSGVNTISSPRWGFNGQTCWSLIPSKVLSGWGWDSRLVHSRWQLRWLSTRSSFQLHWYEIHHLDLDAEANCESTAETWLQAWKHAAKLL